VLPLSCPLCHGFALHKGDFCDAITLRYGWSPLPTVYVVNLTVLNMLSAQFKGEHSLPFIINDIRDLTADFYCLKSQAYDVFTEPSL